MRLSSIGRTGDQYLLLLLDLRDHIYGDLQDAGYDVRWC